jgi:hypothetical protein
METLAIQRGEGRRYLLYSYHPKLVQIYFFVYILRQVGGGILTLF